MENITVSNSEQVLPFSQCNLWKTQREFYQQEGLNVWQKIPFYATSNPFIARRYAQLIINYWKDLLEMQQLNLTAPLYILELGAGPAIFSFYVIKSLVELLDEYNIKFKFVYVISDLVKETVESWQQHPDLKKFLQQGLLDFCCYDIEANQEIALLNRGTTLNRESLLNPLVVIGNYIFDSLKCDFFEVRDNRLKILKMRTDLKLENELHNSIMQLSSLDPSFLYDEIDLPYYNKPAIDALLQHYLQLAVNEKFPFPIGALTCITNLNHITNGRMLLLISDKGFNKPFPWEGYEPEVVAHNNAFSTSVNFYALAQFAKMANGDCFNPHDYQGLNTGVLLFGNKLSDCNSLRVLAADILEYFSPGNFVNLFRHINNTQYNCSLDILLAYLNGSYWDVNIFNGCFNAIVNSLTQAPQILADKLLFGLDKIAENFYFFPGCNDTLSNIASLFYRIGNYEKSLQYFLRSQDYFAENDKTLYNIATCYYTLNQYEQAKIFFEKAYQCNTNNIHALGCLAYLQELEAKNLLDNQVN